MKTIEHYKALNRRLTDEEFLAARKLYGQMKPGRAKTKAEDFLVSQMSFTFVVHEFRRNN